MKTNDITIEQLIKKLESEHGFDREEARNELVKIGEESIPYLKELVNHPQHILRWESMKALSEMKNPDLIPFFIIHLKNDESSLRWIAAEGLSQLGEASLKPLLEALLKESDSVFLLSGAHHIIHDLMSSKSLPKNINGAELLSQLKITTLSEKLKTTVYRILKELI